MADPVRTGRGRFAEQQGQQEGKDELTAYRPRT
jgi:hypothetical protein